MNNYNFLNIIANRIPIIVQNRYANMQRIFNVSTKSVFTYIVQTKKMVIIF